MMRGVVVGMSVAFAASAVTAQNAPKNDALAALGFKIVQPMPDKEVAAVRSKVASSLAVSGYSDLFDNVTDRDGGKARHRASGLVCPLGKKDQRIVSASSDAAQCETKNSGNIYKSAVAKVPESATLDSIETAIRLAVTKEPGFTPAPGPQVVARPTPGSGRPEHRTLHFVSRVDGRERMSRLQVGLVRGWSLTERHEYPNASQPPMGMMDLLEETMFGSNIK